MTETHVYSLFLQYDVFIGLKNVHIQGPIDNILLYDRNFPNVMEEWRWRENVGSQRGPWRLNAIDNVFFMFVWGKISRSPGSLEHYVLLLLLSKCLVRLIDVSHSAFWNGRQRDSRQPRGHTREGGLERMRCTLTLEAQTLPEPLERQIMLLSWASSGPRSACCKCTLE